MPTRFAKQISWLKGYFSFLKQLEVILSILGMISPTIAGLIFVNPLAFQFGFVLSILVFVLITFYFDNQVWGLEIRFSREWSAKLGAASMHQNPVIRIDSSEGCIIEFELEHGLKADSWNLRLKTSSGVVIDDFGPQGRSTDKESYRPPLNKLGTQPVLCVHRQAANHLRIPANVTLELMDLNYPTGNYVVLEIYAGLNLDLTKCKHCRGKDCKQWWWKMKKLEEIKILVTPSCLQT
jgi:hypothetical protein